MTDEHPGPSPGRCTGCGARLLDRARFCASCGKVAEEAAGDPTVVTGAHRTRGASEAAAMTMLPADSGGRTRARDGDAAPGCVACGADNSPERELCTSCGADPRTGERFPAVAAPRPATGSRAPVRTWRSWLIAVVAIVAVVAAIVSGLWWADLGPFADEVELDPVTFPSDRYAGDPTPVPLSGVATATTRSPEGDETFSADHMVDEDPDTVWIQDLDQLPTGLEETIDLYLEEPAWVDAIVVGNGDHRDGDRYAATARLQRATITLDGDVTYDSILLDLGREAQLVSLPEPVLTTSVRIGVVDVVPGTASDDLAISRLGVRGWQADEQDRELAERRAEQLPAAGSVTLTLG